jgi:Streptomycin adenylyltransferase
MPESPVRAIFRERLCAAANRDERFIGLLIAGSGSDERLDEWSDIDAMFFLREDNFEAFMQEWEAWARQFGEMVLVYDPIGFPHTFWTIYHAEPFPQRIEYMFRPESQLDMVLSLSASPSSVAAMVCCDKTGDRLSGYVQQLVGRSLSLPPSEEQQTFKNRYEQLWYILLYSYNKLQRGHQWYAREAFHIGALDSLMALLKLEAHSVERWQASFASWNLERSIPSSRLAQLNACIPAEGVDNMKQAILNAALLGRDVCRSLAESHQWTWPQEAAEEIIRALSI